MAKMNMKCWGKNQAAIVIENERTDKTTDTQTSRSNAEKSLPFAPSIAIKLKLNVYCKPNICSSIEAKCYNRFLWLSKIP